MEVILSYLENMFLNMPKTPEVLRAKEELASMMEGKEGIDSAKINFLTEKLTVESTLDESELYTVLSDTAKAFSKSVKIEK